MFATAMVLLALLLLSCSPEGESEEFVFGVVLVGAQNDHGWSEAHYDAGRYAERQIPGARMIVLDRLNPTERPATTLHDVVDEMVAQGARLIFVASGALAADTDAVASQHPDVWFVHISGDHVLTSEAPENVANYMAKMEYVKAVAGCAAALKTQTGRVGYLGPPVNAEMRRMASAAYLGFRHCYQAYRQPPPDASQFLTNDIVSWLGVSGAVPDASTLADGMFDAGVDVIVSGIDTTEALIKAGQRHDQGEQVWAVLNGHEHACQVKPEACLGAAYYNWGPVYAQLLNRARSGTLQHEWIWVEPYWPDLNNRDLSPVGFSFGDALTEREVHNLQAFMGALAAREVELFAGPLRLRDGTLYVAPGRVASDQEIWDLPDLLEGMEVLGN